MTQLAYAGPSTGLTGLIFVIPFISVGLSRSIGRLVRQHIPEARLVHKNNLSLKSLLVNSKDKLTHLNKSGIYKLTCHDCQASYIGRTIRLLQTRINEYINRSTTSAFGGHLVDEQHSFEVDTGSKILHNITSRNFNRLDFVKDLEITKEMAKNEHCLNNNLNRCYVPLHRRLMN